MKTETNRDGKFDVLRGLAIILVLLIHISADYVYADISSYTYWITAVSNKIFGIAVPTFVALTVFLGLKSGTRRGVGYVLKKLLPLLFIYLAWSIMYIFYSAGIGAPLPGREKLIFENLLQGTSCYHLYYIVMLLQLYIVIALLSHLPVKKLRPHPLLPLAAAVLQLAVMLLFLYRIAFKHGFANTAIFPVFYLTPICWGLMLASDREKTESIFRRYWWLYVAVSIVAVTLRTMLYPYAPLLFEGNAALHTMTDTAIWELSIFGGFPLIYLLADLLRHSRFLAMLGRHSLAIYFAHPMILSLIEAQWHFIGKTDGRLALGMLVKAGITLGGAAAYSLLAEGHKKLRG